MLGFAKGYILRNVTAKTKGLQVFLDDVNVLVMTNNAAAELPQHLEEGSPHLKSKSICLSVYLTVSPYRSLNLALS